MGDGGEMTGESYDGTSESSDRTTVSLTTKLRFCPFPFFFFNNNNNFMPLLILCDFWCVGDFRCE